MVEKEDVTTLSLLFDCGKGGSFNPKDARDVIVAVRGDSVVVGGDVVLIGAVAVLHDGAVPIVDRGVPGKDESGRPCVALCGGTCTCIAGK